MIVFILCNWLAPRFAGCVRSCIGINLWFHSACVVLLSGRSRPKLALGTTGIEGLVVGFTAILSKGFLFVGLKNPKDTSSTNKIIRICRLLHDPHDMNIYIISHKSNNIIIKENVCLHSNVSARKCFISPTLLHNATCMRRGKFNNSNNMIKFIDIETN